MKKLFAIITVAIMSVTLVACSGKPDETTASESAILENQFIGDWEFVDSGDFQDVSFYEDGTYRQITKVSGTELDHTDSFLISENRLILYYDEMGITYTYKVEFDGPDKMTWYNGGNGEMIITYTRKAK